MVEPVVSDSSAVRRVGFNARPWLAPAAIVLLLLLLPLVIQERYPLHLLNIIGVHVILALSLNLVTGYVGLVSVGHAGFYAIGAYTSALLMLRLGWPFLAAAGAALLIAGASGALMALPVLRLRERHYLAIATLAMGEMVRIFLLSAIPLTNGPNGLRAIPPPAFLGFELDSVRATNYFVLALLIFLFVLQRRLLLSPVGKTLVAIREDESACLAIGINVTYYKVMAFAISAAIAGLAGVVYAHYIGYVSPDSFSWRESITFLTMVVVGGLGTVTGAIYGAVTLVLASEYLRAVGSWRFIIYGILLILVVSYSPLGIAGLLQRLSDTMTGRFRRRAASPLREEDSTYGPS